jgi:hypothetical protein
MDVVAVLLFISLFDGVCLENKKRKQAGDPSFDPLLNVSVVECVSSEDDGKVVDCRQICARGSHGANLRADIKT